MKIDFGVNVILFIAAMVIGAFRGVYRQGPVGRVFSHNHGIERGGSPYHH